MLRCWHSGHLASTLTHPSLLGNTGYCPALGRWPPVTKASLYQGTLLRGPMFLGSLLVASTSTSLLSTFVSLCSQWSFCKCSPPTPYVTNQILPIFQGPIPLKGPLFMMLALHSIISSTALYVFFSVALNTFCLILQSGTFIPFLSVSFLRTRRVACLFLQFSKSI